MQLYENDIDNEIKRYFHFITYYYNEKSNFTLTAKYQFKFIHKDVVYDWYLSVDKEKITYSKGIVLDPDIIICTSYLLWLQISSGRKNATIEYLKKTYTIKGPLKILLLFNTYFGSIVTESRLKRKKRPDPWESPEKGLWKKPDSVLVINASPRMEKGFTYRYLKPFIQGMADQTNSIDVINLYKPEIKIESCRGCESCWRGLDGKCVINDDGDVIIQKILESKLTIFALPLYVDSMPAKLKSLMDRFFVQTKPVFEMAADGLTRHPIINQRERYFALFAVCGFPELQHLKPLIDTFKDIGRNFHAPVIANILRPGSQFMYLNPLMAFDRIIVENAIYKAGEEIVNSGKINKKTLKAISNTGKVSMTEWRYYTNMYWADPKKDEL